MGRTVIMERPGTAGRHVAGGPFGARDSGFTLVEISTSVAVLLIVLTAAWMLLTTSTDNLNRIDNGGQASELNRAALASFERDLGHAVLPFTGVSAILAADTRSCSVMVDEDNDTFPELVTWVADDENQRLLRVVTRAPDPLTARLITAVDGFAGGVTTTSTVLAGLSAPGNLGGEPMFHYAIDATHADWQDDPGLIGLVTVRLRNGLPDSESNIIDRTAAFRIIAYVINGY